MRGRSGAGSGVGAGAVSAGAMSCGVFESFNAAPLPDVPQGKSRRSKLGSLGACGVGVGALGGVGVLGGVGGLGGAGCWGNTGSSPGGGLRQAGCGGTFMHAPSMLLDWATSVPCGSTGCTLGRWGLGIGGAVLAARGGGAGLGAGAVAQAAEVRSQRAGARRGESIGVQRTPRKADLTRE